MRRALVDALIELAARDERVVLLTADLGFAFLEAFRDRFPTRFFNVGVAEDNLIGLATGLGADGFVPFAYTMAAFALPRAFEIVRNGPVAHRLPVRIVGVGGGFDYGTDGPSHYALDDLALARALGEIDVFVPADAIQARDAVQAMSGCAGPVYLRLGTELRGVLPIPARAFEPGRIRTLKEGGPRSDVCLLALGPTAFDALEAAPLLEAAGIVTTVVAVSSLRPLLVEDIIRVVSGARMVVTLENHAVEGGLGSLVAEVMAEARLRPRLWRAGVTTRRFAPGRPSYLRAQLGLDASSLARRIGEALREP
ncbi:MAG TPA: transketolase C-terminal domain-containing protein [Vicinamibacteria bacterium]|nr:transketolase C-terminal domain-containing protein [Vicinamibacteria bacterium]